jgi:hypothetical protein
MNMKAKNLSFPMTPLRSVLQNYVRGRRGVRTEYYEKII